MRVKWQSTPVRRAAELTYRCMRIRLHGRTVRLSYGGKMGRDGMEVAGMRTSTEEDKRPVGVWLYFLPGARRVGNWQHSDKRPGGRESRERLEKGRQTDIIRP